MTHTRLLHVRVPAGLVREMDRLIAERGLWADRTELIRDACRRMVERIEAQGAQETVGPDRVRWDEAVEEAEGDEEEARRILAEELGALP